MQSKVHVDIISASREGYERLYILYEPKNTDLLKLATNNSLELQYYTPKALTSTRDLCIRSLRTKKFKYVITRVIWKPKTIRSKKNNQSATTLDGELAKPLAMSCHLDTTNKKD